MKMRLLSLLAVAALGIAGGGRATLAAEPPDFGSLYASVMPTVAAYPAGYYLGGEPFYAYGEDVCHPVTRPCKLTPQQQWDEVRQIVWDQNAQLAVNSGMIDGARTWAFGFGFQEFGNNSGIPQIWVAVARFRTERGARGMAQGFLSPLLDKAGAPNSVTQTTIAPGGEPARYVVGTDAVAGRVEQVTFSRGAMAVMIYMAHTDFRQVTRLGTIIDANLIATGFGQSPAHPPLRTLSSGERLRRRVPERCPAPTCTCSECRREWSSPLSRRSARRAERSSAASEQ